MELTRKLLTELQKRLKIGNRRGVHLNAIPANSRYKFDLNRLSHIDKNLPDNFVKALLSELPLKFRISWKDNVPDLNSLFEEDQMQLVRITKSFENLINQTEAIESEKGINTFGFGFPILARRDHADNVLTAAPILIWSLRIKRTKEFNTWEILRSEEDPIYINEVLINHLQNDVNVEIEQIPSDMLDDGLINKSELIEICSKLLRTINTESTKGLEEMFEKKLDKITSIGDKAHYDKLLLNSSNSFIDFGGLFSIFEVQKQNIINDYDKLMELEGINIDLEDLEGHLFQPISSVETDPSQQSILHSLETTRNVLIQGPPGTGKSQTLTAVLINALESNKKTIVICEKRTALEVLHNALIEKNLNNHCVLIRDIVKDRKTIIDSVRDRVDDSEYKRYQYNYSKESLENLIQKAKYLIANINRKHQKIDKKLIGDKSWSDVVGKLLAEIKDNTDDSRLNIEKNLFHYSTQEQNSLLELVQKGQLLYVDFLPIKATSFIDPLKLVGDNPYSIEQSINEDFDVYSKQLEEIRNILEATRNEFISLRKSELKNQVDSIANCIENIIVKENKLSALVLNAKNDYINFRNIEFENQEKNISLSLKEINEIKIEFSDLLLNQNKIFKDFRNFKLSEQLEVLYQTISLIDLIQKQNSNNEDLKNELKVNSYWFRLTSVFSKKRKKTTLDYLKLIDNFKKLQIVIKNSRDFAETKFENDLQSKFNILLELKKTIEKTKNNFERKCQAEFESFKLSSFLNLIESEKSLQLLEYAIEKESNSENFINTLKNIKYNFIIFKEKTDNDFQNLSKLLLQSNDVKLDYTFKGSIIENIEILSEISSKINQLSNNFSDKIKHEFSRFNLDSILDTNDNSKCFQSLQSEINNSHKSESFRVNLQCIQFTFKNYIFELNTAFQELSKKLTESKDIKLEYTSNKPFPENKEAVLELKAKIELIKTEFDSIIQNEFQEISLLKANPNEIEIKSLPILQEKINDLADKIKGDSWTIEKLKFTEFYKCISEIETLIRSKNEYFGSEKDLFTIEFKWFQFYNALSALNKIIVNELKSKSNWGKSFLVFYLNSLLVSRSL